MINDWAKERKVFITATDTDAGKTFVSIQYMKALREKGLDPFYFKPFATGAIESDGERISEDVLSVKKHLDIHDDSKTMNPSLLTPPAAPLIAHEMTGELIDIDLIKERFNRLNQEKDSLVVEGIGGVMVPIIKNYTVIDMIKDFKLPVIVVSKVILGMINHTVLTIDALLKQNISVLGFVINNTSHDNVSESVSRSFDVIERMIGVPMIQKFEYDQRF